MVLYGKHAHYFILGLFRVLPQWFICTVSGTQLLPNIQHSVNIKITPNQRLFWRNSGFISMNIFVFEDRLIFLWRISPWMPPLKSLHIRNRMLVNQRYEEFSLAVFSYIGSGNKLSLQPLLEWKRRGKQMSASFVITGDCWLCLSHCSSFSIYFILL